MSAELKILERHLKEKKLRITRQRKQILDSFLGTEAHLTVDNLYDIVRKVNPGIGRPTVFRTLKLLCEAGLAKQVRLDDKRTRYEHKYGHSHHDHIICLECGKSFEAFDERIEELQVAMCGRFNVIPVRHRLEIFGFCGNCSGAAERKRRGKIIL